MALVYADRVQETSTTTGTGTYDLAGAVTGFQTFVAGIGTANTCHYCANDGTNWEVGLGTVTDAAPDTLARTRILASSNSNAAVSWAAGTRNIFVTLPGKSTFLRGHIFGLTMSNAADTVNDITVGVGEACDEAGNADIILTAAITKQLDATWAVGTNAGGLNTGAKANSTWYEVHLIKRLDTGVVDVMFTTTANRATLPANYTLQRRIGWIRNNASPTILQFIQVDDYVTWVTQAADVASVAVSATAAQKVLTVPPNSVARFRGTLTVSTGAAADNVTIVFSEVVEGNVTPAVGTAICSLHIKSATTAAWSAAGHFDLRTDASSQIEHDGVIGAGAGTFSISTYGYIDHRSRLS